MRSTADWNSEYKLEKAVERLTIDIHYGPEVVEGLQPVYDVMEMLWKCEENLVETYW